MVNGNGTFVYNGYDADGSWYPPVEPVRPRVYHEKARVENIKDILYPDLFPKTEEEEGESGEGEEQVNPAPVVEPEEPDAPAEEL